MSPNANDDIPHSLPIPIGGGRRRSQSVSDSSSSASSDSASISPPSPLRSPTLGTGALPRVGPISPSTSPVLSYFLAQSPTKSPPSATFPFRRGMAGPPLFEDEEIFEGEKPMRHGRRASAAAWPGHDRFPPAPVPVAPAANTQQDRAAGLLRRLSLGGSMVRQPPVPAKPVTTTAQAPRSTTPPGLSSTPTPGGPALGRKPRRANTLAPGTPRPPRAPSPMGERILKGHFDGFN